MPDDSTTPELPDSVRDLLTHYRGRIGADRLERAMLDALRRLEVVRPEADTRSLDGDERSSSPGSRDDVGSGTAPYELRGEIARGGMGSVLEAYDVRLRRTVAMKVVLSPPAGETDGPDPAMLARFREEAQITGQLEHPGVVPVHDMGIDDGGRAYFTMRFVRGETFRDVIRAVHRGDETWTLTRAVHVLLRVCETVAFAHDKGVIHRDLKPANVMVGRFGEVYVMDWGLARTLGEDPASERDGEAESSAIRPVATDRQESRRHDSRSPIVTMEGTVLGSPFYMSPEQATGRSDQVDARTDVYAAGAMLYQLLTGRLPYGDDEEKISPIEFLERVRSGPPPPIHRVRPGVPAEIQSICELAMARDPSERYAHMGALADDLRAYLELRVVRAHPAGFTSRLTKWARRNKGAAAAILLAATLTAILIGFLSSRITSARARRALADQVVAVGTSIDEGRLERAERLLDASIEGGLPADLALELARRVEVAKLDTAAARRAELEDWRRRWRAGIPSPRVVTWQPVGVPMTFSPDGRELVTTHGRAFHVVDLDDDAVRLVVPTESDVEIVHYAGEDRLVVATLSDTAVYDVRDGRRLRTLHERSARSLASSPDARRVAVVRDRHALLFDVDGDGPPAVLRGDSRLTDCRFSGDGRHLCGIGADGTGYAWDLERGTRQLLVHETEPDARPSLSQLVARDLPGVVRTAGDLVATVSSRGVAIWRLGESEALGEWSLQELGIDLAGRRGLRHRAEITASFTDEGLFVAAPRWDEASSASSDVDTVILRLSVDPPSADVVMGEGHGWVVPRGLEDPLYPLTISAPSMSSENHARITRWDLTESTPRAIEERWTPGVDDLMDVTASRTRVAGTDGIDSVFAYELDGEDGGDWTTRLLTRPATSRRRRSVPYAAPDATRVVLIDYFHSHAMVVDAEARVLGRYPLDKLWNEPRVAFTPNGSVLVQNCFPRGASSPDESASVCVLAPGDDLRRSDRHWDEWIEDGAVVPLSPARVTVLEDRRTKSGDHRSSLSVRVLVREGVQATLRVPIELRDGTVARVDDGRRVVITADTMAAVYSTEDGRALQSLRGTGFHLSCLSPDGRWVATSSDDETIVWRADPGRSRAAEVLQRLPFGALRAPHFTPDGEFLWLWDFDLGRLVRVEDGLEVVRVFGLEQARAIPGGHFASARPVEDLWLLDEQRSSGLDRRAAELESDEIVEAWLNTVHATPPGEALPLPPRATLEPLPTLEVEVTDATIRAVARTTTSRRIDDALMVRLPNQDEEIRVPGGDWDAAMSAMRWSLELESLFPRGHRSLFVSLRLTARDLREDGSPGSRTSTRTVRMETPATLRQRARELRRR